MRPRLRQFFGSSFGDARGRMHLQTRSVELRSILLHLLRTARSAELFFLLRSRSRDPGCHRQCSRFARLREGNRTFADQTRCLLGEKKRVRRHCELPIDKAFFSRAVFNRTRAAKEKQFADTLLFLRIPRRWGKSWRAENFDLSEHGASNSREQERSAQAAWGFSRIS